MSLDTQEFSLQPDFLASWAMQEGFWDGSVVNEDSIQEISRQAFNKMHMQLLDGESEDLSSAKISILAARLGCQNMQRILLEQDIEELGLNHVGYISHIGAGKSLKKFWKEHKVEILIGIAAVAVITAFAVVAIATAGSAVASVAALGSVASPDDAEKSASSTSNPPLDLSPPSDPNFVANMDSSASKIPIQEMPPSIFSDNISDYLTPWENKSWNEKTNPIFLGNQYFATDEISFENFSYNGLDADGINLPFTYLDHINGFSTQDQINLSLEQQIQALRDSIASKEQNFNPNQLVDSQSPLVLENLLELLPRDLPVYNKDNPPPVPIKSYHNPLVLDGIVYRTGDMKGINDTDYSDIQCLTFTTKPVRNSNFWVGGINGINTNILEAIDHAEYIDRFSGNMGIDWVYNRSNGVILDVFEAGIVNMIYSSSPKTSDLLIQNWENFYEATKDKPNLKYLQFCHSQGALHVKNALRHTPEEIAKKIYIVAVAPATVIPQKMCGGSVNIASKKDLVPNLEKILIERFVVVKSIYDVSKRAAALYNYNEERKELILLDPHPDAKGIDHDFQSSTYQSIIKYYIKKYKETEGELNCELIKPS